MLLDLGEERFFKPAYLRPRGWIGIRLDLDPVDWNEVADFVTESYEAVRWSGGQAARREDDKTRS